MLEIISQSPELSQRQMASSAGMSLGLINLIIKRLLQTGHIKVANMNRRKMNYLLTPKGMKEKSDRAHSYVFRTIQVLSEYQARLQQLVDELLQAQHTSFAILGEGEVAYLMEVCLKTTAPHVPYRFISETHRPDANEAILDCRLKSETGGVGISVLARLLQVTQPAPKN